MNITTFTERFLSLEIFNTIPGRFNQNQSRNHVKFFYSVWYLTDCGSVQTVLLGAVRSHLSAWSVSGRALVISGELQAGGIV
jgi:hypothetical protein